MLGLIFINLGFVTWALSFSFSDQFTLSNAPAALTSLATSASAHASSPHEPTTHITNLRRNQKKAEQLQSEKLLVENEYSSDDSLQDDNEASPSLLQKKIGKILTKIRFLSALTGASSGSGGGNVSNTTDEVNIDKDPDTSFNETSTKTNEDVTTERIPTFQKIIYPHSKYGAPLKLSLHLDERILNRPHTEETEDVIEQSQNIEMVEDPSRIGQIGVFFAEIVGSIVGLLYGAAAQITSGSLGERSVE